MNGKLGVVLALLLISVALSQGKRIPAETHLPAALPWHLPRRVSLQKGSFMLVSAS